MSRYYEYIVVLEFLNGRKRQIRLQGITGNFNYEFGYIFEYNEKVFKIDIKLTNEIAGFNYMFAKQLSKDKDLKTIYQTRDSYKGIILDITPMVVDDIRCET